MEIINNTPFKVEVMPFNNGPEGGPVFTVIIKGTFNITSNDMAEIAEVQIPITFGDEPFDEKKGGSIKFESEIFPYKPRTDIVLVGKAYAPPGKAALVLDVSLRVGDVNKRLRVFGDRKWKYPSKIMPICMSYPEPFTEMEITYERAFGGIDMHGGGFCKENLVGKGYFEKKSKKTIHNASLPNIEDPNNLIKSWKAKPKPVGFGFYGRAWHPRIRYLGTYDEKWREERSPGLPEDFQFDYYNGAHPDLQVVGYLKGDEEVELINLSSEGVLKFNLPNVAPVATVLKTHWFDEVIGEKAGEKEKVEDEKEEMLLGENEEFEENSYNYDEEGMEEEIGEEREEGLEEEELTIHLDTLCMIPDEKRFYIVWRGFCPVKDISVLEIKTLEISV